MAKKTNIAYCSDLHLDNYRFYPAQFIENQNNDILIIAGDLGQYQYLSRHKTFLEELCDNYEYVLFVEGNHEFYNGDINDAFPFKTPDNFILLRNNTFEYKDIIFYGGTMWSGLTNVTDPTTLHAIQTMINDFRIIKNGPINFDLTKMTSLYNEFMENLYETLLTHDNDKKIVVISHFAPSLQSVAPQFKDSPLNPYFCNDIDEFIKGSQIKYWIHGHTHNHCNYMVGNVNVLCNPRGYPGESQRTHKIKQIRL